MSEFDLTGITEQTGGQGSGSFAGETHLARLWLPLLGALLVTLGLLLPVFAQARNSTVEFVVESAPEPLTVGDRVTLRLAVTHPADVEVPLPSLGQEWGPFEVLDQSAPERVDHDDGTATTSKDFVVTLFAPGEYQTPPLTITQRLRDGTLADLAAPSIRLEVSSVLTEDLALRDLKPQASLPVPPLWPWLLGGLWLVGLLATVLAGASFWAYRRWFRRPAPGVAAPLFVDPRPPEVIARAELDRIEALDLPARNRIKEHYSLVADCLRRYIEGRYGLPALERTTGELRQAFRGAATPAPRQRVNAFLDLFTESDLVKFARYIPPREAISRLIPGARRIIDETTPPPEPAATPEEPQ